MTNQSYFDTYWDDIRRLSAHASTEELTTLATLIMDCHKRGGKVMIFGNGGSAGIASHVSVDLTKAAGIRAICYNESALLTCFANDFGYEKWVEKAIEFYADDDDLIILISSSGQSENMLNAAQLCAGRKLPLVTLSGFSPANPLRAFGELPLWVDSQSYNHVETIHQTWLLAAIDYIISLKNEA